MKKKIVSLVLEHYPSVQAIYLFGSYGTLYEHEDSDVDIAILLPPQEAKKARTLALSDLRYELEGFFKKEVDLINLRRVPTVLQKEIIADNRRIYCADLYSADEFDMLIFSYYQRLNGEREEIIQEVLKTGRIVA